MSGEGAADGFGIPTAPPLIEPTKPGELDSRTNEKSVLPANPSGTTSPLLTAKNYPVSDGPESKPRMILRRTQTLSSYYGTSELQNILFAASADTPFENSSLLLQTKTSDDTPPTPQKKLIRIKLPNSSYRTFPVLPETTVGMIMDKISSKLSVDSKIVNKDLSRIFKVVKHSGEEVELDKDEFVATIIENNPKNSEYLYKQKGQKLVDRDEELKIIEQQNNLLKLGRIDDAVKGWQGDSLNLDFESPLIELDQRYSFSKIPFPISNFFEASLSVVTSEKGFTLFCHANSISSMLQEKCAISKRIFHQKRLKSKTHNALFVDFSSKVLVTKKHSFSLLRKNSESRSSTVVVSGWTCMMNEYLCRDRQSTRGVLWECSLLEALPYHLHIVHYLYHDKIEMDSTVRLFTASHGHSLENYVKEDLDKLEELSFALIRYILLSLCDAMCFLHSYNIVHCNITPLSIFLRVTEGHDNHLVLGQLLYSRKLDQSSIDACDDHITQYTAPEMIGNAVDSPASDIYSFGMICYFLLTGKHPYGYIDGSEAIKKAIQKKEKPTCEANGNKKLFAVFYDICTAPDPTSRPDAMQLKQMIWNLTLTPE